MPIVHITTELSGGAGSVVRNLHTAMLALGMPSLVLTRERNGIPHVRLVKPINRVSTSLRARWRRVLNWFGYVKSAYAMFGIEKCPAKLDDIQNSLGEDAPSAFIFYWVSRFVNLETVFELRRAYPKIPFVFIPLDEALLTGGCHYSNACCGFHDDCRACPATISKHLKRKIEKGFILKRDLISDIDPLVIYSTTNIYKEGQKSTALKNARSRVMPLGAVSKRELNLAKQDSNRDIKEGKVTLLIRSSIEYRKGCDMFVSAIKDLSKEVPDLRARLKVISIGDEALKNAHIEKYVDHVDMGYVKREELISIYCETDVFVMTSRVEGGPLMINECVALEIFVISTPVGVAGDLIINQANGIITKDISSESITASIMEFLNNYRKYMISLRKNSGTEIKENNLTFEDYAKELSGVVGASALTQV